MSAGYRRVSRSHNRLILYQPLPLSTGIKFWDAISGTKTPVLLPRFVSIVFNGYYQAFGGMTCVNDFGFNSSAMDIYRCSDQIRMFSFDVDFDLFAASNDTNAVVRWAIVYDHQPDVNHKPLVSDIFGDNSGVVHVYSGVNMVNCMRYVVVRDRTVHINAAECLVRHVHLTVKGCWDVSLNPIRKGWVGVSSGALYFIAGTHVYSGSGVNMQPLSFRISYYEKFNGINGI